MSSSTQYSVVVPAAGIGKRMQATCPKQYLKIAGATIIEHTLNNLLSHPQIKQAIVVLNPEDQFFAQLPIASHLGVHTVLGGSERCDSVLAGLNVLPDDEHWVLVHDAARPCLMQSDLTKLLEVTSKSDVGGILATPVRDTMKRASTALATELPVIEKTESRENLWHALTPQLFNLALLKSALNQAAKEHVLITDEASAIEYLGKEVTLVEGQASNIKVTQPEDLLLAEFYLTHKERYTGTSNTL